MRKFLSILLLLTGAMFAPSVFAQNLTQQYQATAYGKWTVAGYAPNSFTFAPASCMVTGPSGNFVPFSTTAPILVVDANPALNEVLTPSAVTVSGATCTLTVAPANQHFSFNIQSGTCGLQEALNTAGSGQQAVVVVTPDFANRGCNTSTILASTATSNITLSDQRQAPYGSYSWSGTAFVVSATNLTAPTVTYSTGAGTGPASTSITGTGTSGVVQFTSGTTPAASGLIFTMTWPSIANGGFAYKPACSITPYGANAYSSGVTATTAGPPATATLTASSTALVASTAYKFAYTCS